MIVGPCKTLMMDGEPSSLTLKHIRDSSRSVSVLGRRIYACSLLLSLP